MQRSAVHRRAHLPSHLYRQGHASPKFSSLLLCLALGATSACNAASAPEPTAAARTEALEGQPPSLTGQAAASTPAATGNAAELAEATTSSAASCGGSGRDPGHGSCSAEGSSCGCGGPETSDAHGSDHDHGASCGGEAGQARAAAHVQADAPRQQAATLSRVDDPSQICMVRNHYMGRPQLAVEADGSTYYGCCAGCANRLLQDPRARQAVDPVSHNPVDKALAVLAKTPRGRVLYFENETNLELFRASIPTLQ